MFIGRSRAIETHGVHVMENSVVGADRREPAHTEQGIEAACGLVVDGLPATGHPVVLVHPPCDPGTHQANGESETTPETTLSVWRSTHDTHGSSSDGR
ncbi:hypothetical protein [Kitasatospora sp. NPDC086791]|uniref:hypothetical protein n=1 Tax=Kitasatospora sp. NPDC086791 TaxID=3155178 RepID=UPI003416B815